jgi:fatty acid desaturase
VVNPSLRLQHDLCRELVRELGRESLRSYHSPDARRTLFALGHIWLAIALGFWLGSCVLELPLLFAVPSALAVALFMATRINALNVLVHEGSHGALARGRRLNSALTNWGAGYAILFDDDSYRALHGRHHRMLNEATDPDLPLYAIGRERRGVLRGLLADLFWVSIARRALVYREHLHVPSRPGTPSTVVHAARKVGLNLLLLAVLVILQGLVQGVMLYALFWVVPLFSFYPMIIRLRLITEHFAPEVFDPATPPVFVARTSVCGPIEHYLFGAQMDYHFEHHIFPAIPYHQLRRMHADLVQRGFFERSSRVVVDYALSGGYFHYWRRLLRSEWFSGARVDVPLAT